MKNIFQLALLLLLTSCFNSNQETPLHASAGGSTETLLDADTNTIPAPAGVQVPEASEECIFDQATQTDEFLRGIPELDGYEWNQESRTATILLQPGDTLIITRGGCNHFTVAATFKLSNDKTDYSDWGNVYQKVLWIAKILEGEFFYRELMADIQSNRVSIESFHHADVASFENEMLVDNGYEVERSLLHGKTIIVLRKMII